MAEDDVTSIGRDGHGQAELLAGVLRAATEFSIIATDADGTITVFNEGAERMLGYGADEVVGRMTPELIHDPREVAARAAELGLNPSFEVFVALVRNGEAETREWTYVCKDGSRIPVSVTVTAIRDAAGEVTGFVGIARDITESRRVQTELRTAEELFRRTFEGSAIGVALVAPDGRWLEVNPALCDLLGYTAAELLAGSFQEITHPDDLQTDLELVADVLAGRLEGYEMEKRYLRKDGSAIWGLLTVALVRAEDGTPLHFVSQVQDITARKQAEAALAHQATHDDLTGLWNRRRMDEELSRIAAHARRYGSDAALLLIDLDGFKAINDRLGHAAGDTFLNAVGAALRGALRESDSCARIGGDEFAVLLPHSDEERARLTAERIVDGISGLRAGRSPDDPTASASVGVALLTVDEDPDAWMRTADVALYRAKAEGGARVVVATPPA
ncbi:MAG: sensor domain-containing diguanylate cyclase [Solirubrobacteraceae bacterium]